MANPNARPNGCQPAAPRVIPPHRMRASENAPHTVRGMPNDAWSLPAAERLAHDALTASGAGRPRLSLARFAMTAVFRAGELCVKVVPHTHRDPAALNLEHRLLTDLAAAGIPVPVPVAVVHGEGLSAAITSWVDHDLGATLNWARVGATLAALHRLPAPDYLPPWSDRSGVYRQRIERLRGAGTLAGPDADGLLALLERAPNVRATGRTITHGDLQTGNLLTTASEVVLVDWELARASTPAADLASLVNRRLRFGLSETTYAAFCDGYGRADLADLPDVAARCALRDVGGTTYLLSCSGPTQAAEGRRRLRDLLDGTQSTWFDR